jgi:hypothetical protein
LSNFGKAIKKIGQKMKGTENPEISEANPSSSSTNVTHKAYLRALPLRALEDIEVIKNEVKSGNILILRITPLAKKSVEEVRQAVNELCEFVEHLGGDIARLGEERVVVTPSSIRIWREKTPMPTEETATAA